MSIVSWQRFNIGLRLILCGGPFVMCVFSLAEFPTAAGWWMLSTGTGVVVLMLTTAGVCIIATRNAVWLVAVPFWVVRIKIGDIATITTVNVRPLEDFGGWGVKGGSRRGGLLLAADGQRAVQITRANGQVFLATSNDAERAVTEINDAAAARHGPPRADGAA